jgi:hypothetical protein
MKRIFAVITFTLLVTLAGEPGQAAKTACRGDAARDQPPIPNYPTHIRNVVWRNMRMMCLHELANKSKNPVTPDQSSQDAPTTPSPNESKPENRPQTAP